LEYVIATAIVAALVGIQLTREARARKRAAAQTSASPPAPPPESLAARLHRLEDVFAPFGSAAAHPRDLAEHPQFKEAASLLAGAEVPLAAVLQYAQGANWGLSCAALAALAKREDREQAVETVVAHFDKLAPWAMYFALDLLAEGDGRPPVGAPAVGAKDWWPNNPVIPLFFREYLTRRAELGDYAEFGPALHLPHASGTALIKTFLERLNHPLARDLVEELERLRRANIDRNFLTSFGRFWNDQVEPQALVPPSAWDAPFASAEATLAQTPVRSLLVSGEQLVGKTSFLKLLARRLRDRGWSIFEASGPDLMAGQIWFGQLEERVRRVADEVTVGKKLVWYVPDLLALARSGTHQGQSASILDQILPAIAAGRLAIWTEAAPTGTARLLQTRPVLRNVLEIVRLEPQSEADTAVLAKAVVHNLAVELQATIEEDCAVVALACARQYLSASSFPGSALHLLRLTAGRADKGARITPHDVLKTLSQHTGLPISILDHKERIDLGTVRKFFASRLVGQDDAVSSVVERIAMLKAGLNDPGRPIAVFLFAGPTGTGKTELAKAAAEFLFGAPERMIRLDMSELQSADSTLKILGDGAYGEADSLISRVRKQPFSVVLLDEFDKAHPRIWDLFLQVFDEGRLTDTLGQIADFRHCLIILTTNLGATSHQSTGLGFAPPADVFAAEQVTRAVAQTYRPEFQNRLDKVIVFRPLTRDLMRVILKKELSRVLERRGLKDRAWAVEWEASALEFLLEKGFSPEMGARPLKRAIDQYVIAPLAATIVERRVPEGDQFVFFRSDGRAIQAEFVDPDADSMPASTPGEGEPAGPPPALASMILGPRGTTRELEALATEHAKLEQTFASVEWEELKGRLAAQMSVADFWTKPERFATLARFALMDRVAAAFGTAEALRGRLARGTGRPAHYSRELVSRLALQLHLVAQGVNDVLEAAPIEVALIVEPALEPTASKATREWCEKLLGMYRAWSSNRHMQDSEMPRGNRELPMLLVSGFGAHRVLSRESGLHVFELTDATDGPNRVTARVRLAVAPLGDLPPPWLRSALIQAFEQAAPSNTVVRRYRGEPAPLVRNADGTWRTGKLDAVLRGDFDLLAADE
jgi:ATP-dependent Clp protease ATP-binding subunit ClpC